MLKIVYAFIFLLATTTCISQSDAGYKLPPKEIADLLLAKPTPAVSLDSKGEWLLLSDRNSYPSVEELALPELRIAGLRINPNNFAPSRQNFINNFTLKNIRTGKEYPVTGLPSPLMAGNITRNAAENKIAFTHTSASRVDIYIIDVATQKATRVSKQPVNTIFGEPYAWLNNNTLIYKTALKPASAAPPKPLLPKGPAMQENLGKAAPSRTYQDLIKTPYDEDLFAFFATAQLVKNTNGVETPIGKPGIYGSVQVSPDQQYLLTETIQRPFSYLVPAFGFPSVQAITDVSGKLVKVLRELPSAEASPSGFDNVQDVARDFAWRADAPATVTWCEPLDSGLIKNKSAYHDAVYALSAPFSGEAKEIFKTQMRYRGIVWGNQNLAVCYEGLSGKQVSRLSSVDPATGKTETLLDRNTTDAYGNPGTPVTARNKYGREVLLTTDNGTKLLMNNTVGSSPKGDLPFLAKFDLGTKNNQIIWRSAEDAYEFVEDVIDADKLIVLTRRESQVQVPNYFLKHISDGSPDVAITHFTDPYPALQGVTKEKILYKRADSVDLTGDLYLPKGYNAKRDGPLPVLIWAYPREFNSAADAAQVRGSKNRFTTISWASPVYWVTQGYAVLDNAEMPIVKRGDSSKPNDSFIEQLQQNAAAAIDKLSSLGVGDRNRVAVGGHSYGAFMTANLLAHTNLFRAGIARSGAYNRSLTPFGFQNEDRTYWQDPKLYFDMSPFSFADKIKTPLLLIHGEMDDNQGTFPIQSERMYNAIKGHGGTVRYVVLPYEAHGYRGRENLLHMLYEQNAWLDKYVKNAPKTQAGKAEKMGF